MIVKAKLIPEDAIENNILVLLSKPQNKIIQNNPFDNCDQFNFSIRNKKDSFGIFECEIGKQDMVLEKVEKMKVILISKDNEEKTK